MRAVPMSLCLVVALCTGGIANGGWTEFWQRVSLDFHRVNCWPEPFLQHDHDATRTAFNVMTDNGWRLHNTLSDELFEPGTGLLTGAGERKVRWIVTQAPITRRTVFVLRAQNPQFTEIRLDAVQQAVVRILPNGSLPQVLLTDIAPPGGAGDYLDQVNIRVKSTIPSPRLPEMETSGEN